MKQRIFAVVESDPEGNYEQYLCLARFDGAPTGGVLVFPGESVRGEKPSKARASFKTHADARRAIHRTEHFRLAYGYDGMPKAADCRVQAIELPS